MNNHGRLNQAIHFTKILLKTHLQTNTAVPINLIKNVRNQVLDARNIRIVNGIK